MNLFIKQRRSSEGVMGRWNQKSTPEEKVLWLRGHPELWDAEPTVIVKAMKCSGLVAPSTYPPDVRLADVIAEAKRIGLT
jgi:hypothetical protein